jgi:phosphoglycerate kinase
MQANHCPALQILAADSVRNRRILLRVDYNDGNIPQLGAALEHRIRSSLPTLRALLAEGARVGILTHRGRPQGKVVPALSTAGLATTLSQMLGQQIPFVPDCIGRIAAQAMAKVGPGQAVLFENTRFHLGEQLNQMRFAEELAKLGDALVIEAFASAHRRQASTHALSALLPYGYGTQYVREVGWLRDWQEAHRNRMMLVGGAQVLPKIELLHRCIASTQVMMLGGVIGQTLLAAKDLNLQESTVEFGAIESARNLLAEAGVLGCRIHLPRDIVASTLEGHIAVRRPHQLRPGEMAQDLGPLTLETWVRVINEPRALIWFGSVGAWEHIAFRNATRTLAEALLMRHKTQPKALTLVGGNGLLQALGELEMFNTLQAAGVHLSTGGGALQHALGGTIIAGLEAPQGSPFHNAEVYAPL